LSCGGELLKRRGRYGLKTIYENLNEEIRELEDLLTERTEWDQIPQSDFSINVGREDKFLFEIRPKEQ